MFNKKIIACVFIFFSFFAYSDLEKNADRLSISGDNLQLIGSVSSAISANDDRWAAIGWELSVVGRLVEKGDISAGEIPKTRHYVWQFMHIQAWSLNLTPNLSNGRKIMIAVKNFQAPDVSDHDKKAKLFADYVLKVTDTAKKKLAQEKKSIGDAEIAQFLGKYATDVNVKMFKNIFFLAGLDTMSDKIIDKTNTKSK